MPEFIPSWTTRLLWALMALILAVAVAMGVIWWQGRPGRYLSRAEAAVREDDPDEALAWLAVPEIAPATRERALLLRARIAVERGELPSAVRALDQVNPDGPSGADYAFWKGRTLYAAGRPLPAIASLIASLKKRPDDAETYRWLAVVSYDQGNRQTAVSALEAVTRLQPEDARAWRTLGLIFKEDVEYERARVAFERSLAIDRAQPAVHLELAETLIKLGDTTGAERELAACRGRDSPARYAELLATCARLRGDLTGFRAAVDSGLSVAPHHPGLLAQRAQIDLANGRPAEAIAYLDRAVAADPCQPEIFYQRGLVLRQLGRPEEARRDLARADELNEGLAEMSALNRQAERAPHDADIRYRLGRLCVELGKPELAASWYRAALACDPGHAAARFGLRALRPRGQFGGPRP
ncbi:MAG: tetratricopeptide repeat protein [Isosphaeraceae bacterium]